jgi:release factor glutamine methyltransferase
MEESDVDAPWLTALVLLEHTTGVGREAVLAHPELVPESAGVAAFRALVNRRCQREPTAYLLGYREFFGRRFAVTPATLIPRPETEGLISLTLDRIDRMVNEAPLTFLDVGTGSGAIAVTLLTQRPQLLALVLDRIEKALRIARINAATHEVAGRLRLVATHVLDGIRGQFPLIVANLPYVPSGAIASLQPEVARYEPRSALDGGEDGLDLIDALLAASVEALAPRGSILVEIGDGQADQARTLARTRFPDSRIAVENDTAGSPRFLVVDRAL